VEESVQSQQREGRESAEAPESDGAFSVEYPIDRRYQDWTELNAFVLGEQSVGEGSKNTIKIFRRRRSENGSYHGVLFVGDNESGFQI